MNVFILLMLMLSLVGSGDAITVLPAVAVFYFIHFIFCIVCGQRSSLICENVMECDQDGLQAKGEP